MWLDKFFFIKSGFFFSASAGGREFSVGVQHINPPRCQHAVGFRSQGQPGFAQLLESCGPNPGDDFPNFERQPAVDFFQRRPTPHQQIPDGDGQFARDRPRGQIDGAFARQQFFAPLGQRMAGTQNGLGGFDQQTAQVFAAMAGDAAGPLSLAAVVEGRIEADVFDEFAGLGKALDIADEGPQGKGHHFPDAAEPDQGQELWVGEHFLGDETPPVIPLLVGMAQFHEHPFEDLPLAGRPGFE